MDGRAGKHAGQKRTYRAVGDALYHFFNFHYFLDVECCIFYITVGNISDQFCKNT